MKTISYSYFYMLKVKKNLSTYFHSFIEIDFSKNKTSYIYIIKDKIYRKIIILIEFGLY